MNQPKDFEPRNRTSTHLAPVPLDAMQWHRRRDLEGGKELGVWLLIDENDDTVTDELYVESHEYRGGKFDVYTTSEDGEWTHHGEFETVDAAFGKARDVIEDSGRPTASEWD